MLEQTGRRLYVRFLVALLWLDVEVSEGQLSRAAADAQFAAALQCWLRELEHDHGRAGVRAFSERARPLVEELEGRQRRGIG